MDTYDLSHKLAYAGRRSPVPFITGPEYLNSVPGNPVLSELRIFIPPDSWSEENIIVVAREICRALGSMALFDIGMAMASAPTYRADRPASGNIARLTKQDPAEPIVHLRFRSGERDQVFSARYPRLQFEPSGDDFWRTVYSTGAVKLPTQQ
jgi:hypothetical protein